MNRTAFGRITIAFGGAVALAAAWTVTAWAGGYTVSACSPFTTPGPWGEVNTAPTGLSAGNMCGGPAVGPLGGGAQGSLFAQDNVQSPGTHIPGGAEAGWSFAAPLGTTVTAVSYYRNLAATTDNLVVGLFQADGSRLETCQGTFQNNFSCTVPNNQAPATFAGLSTSGLFFGVECRLQGAEQYCLAGSPGDQFATAEMYSATVTLTEQSSPVVSSESGPLWSGGVVSGTVPLGFQASDPSGVARFSVSDGAALGGGAQESCDFTQSVPCPLLQPGAVSVDTTRFPDGGGQVALVVMDAAGNTTVASSPTLIVDNNGPPAPRSFTASAAGIGSRVVDLAWSDPVSPPQPVTAAFAQLCQAACGPAVALGAVGAGQITAPAPGSYTVRLWLVDSAGKGGPQNSATTAVNVPASSSGGGKTGGPGGSANRLHITEHLGSRRLAVAVSVPRGERGLVTIDLDIPRGRHPFLIARHKVRPHRGKATAVFALSRRAWRAPELLVWATAAGVRTGRLTVDLRHRHRS